MTKTEPTSAYWSHELEKARAQGAFPRWYRFMDAIYGDLLGQEAGRPSLKTDLFEEARGGRAPLARMPGPRYGVDLSPDVVAAAHRHMDLDGTAARLAVADVRSLPFADGFFHLILSGSTLDHFEAPDEIGRSLRELARVLAPGGTLILTLDNPHNPVLALRARLRGLDRLRLDPYYVGATLTRSAGLAALREAGFTVRAFGAVAHVPRDPAMRASRLLDRHARSGGDRWLRFLMSFERLRDTPLALRTGYYLAFRATRDAAPSPAAAA